MADFTIVQQHSLSMEGARAAAQKVADQMAVDYEMTHQWVGDVLEFKRSGFSGALALSEGSVQLEVVLGFMLRGFAKKIEEQVSKNMHKVFCGNEDQDAA
ncbi:PHA_gran_rgn, putative polyhydroxyalkanoic acid system protein [Oxalobacteraceae bacterium]|jgi:putative polyhydroxyalkanoate system protein